MAKSKIAKDELQQENIEHVKEKRNKIKEKPIKENIDHVKQKKYRLEKNSITKNNTDGESYKEKRKEEIDQKNDLKKKENKLNIKSILLRITLVIAILGLILSSYHIIKWLIDTERTNELIDSIKEETKVNEIDDTNSTIIIPQENKEDPYWDYIKVKLIDVNFDDLIKRNKDTVAWIKVNGTNINYPVVQTDDNTYYLNKSFDKSPNSAGWVFMDYRNDNKLTNQNTIIYAHGRVEQTMFGSLKKTLTKDWQKDKDNHIIRISTPYSNTLWQVFSVYKIDETSDYLDTSFKTDKEYEDFLKLIQDRSVYDFNTSVTKDDRIITLSTCYNRFKRVVVHAKLIKEEVK